MSILKFEIDTDDIISTYGYIEDCTPFEELIKNGLDSAVKAKVIKNFSDEKMQPIIKNISLECVHQITKKLHALINEDIAITDRWGKPSFIGSVEDFIKKEIDNKMLHPVDSHGKTLSGSCGTTTKTWIEWKVEKSIETQLSAIDRHLENIANYHCKKTIDTKIKNFKNGGLNKLIMERLEAAGVK